MVLGKHGVHRGHEGLKSLAQFLREEMPGATFEYTTQLVEGEAAFLEWTARSESIRVSDGADSFFIRDRLVAAQTIHYTVESLGRGAGATAAQAHASVATSAAYEALDGRGAVGAPQGGTGREPIVTP